MSVELCNWHRTDTFLFPAVCPEFPRFHGVINTEHAGNYSKVIVN